MNKRTEALQAGQTFYSTGKACRRGHMSQRYTSSGTCCQCQLDSSTTFATMRKQAGTAINWPELYANVCTIEYSGNEIAQRTLQAAINTCLTQVNRL